MNVNQKLLYGRIGDTIKERRREFGWSQEHLAKLAGLERTSVTHIESARQKAPLHVLYRLCQELTLDVGVLFPPIEDVTVEEAGDRPVEVIEMNRHTAARPKTAAFISGQLEQWPAHNKHQSQSAPRATGRKISPRS
jgi:transcriptional regulator with XRE-family HTH domain